MNDLIFSIICVFAIIGIVVIIFSILNFIGKRVERHDIKERKKDLMWDYISRSILKNGLNEERNRLTDIQKDFEELY